MEKLTPYEEPVSVDPETEVSQPPISEVAQYEHTPSTPPPTPRKTGFFRAILTMAALASATGTSEAGLKKTEEKPSPKPTTEHVEKDFGGVAVLNESALFKKFKENEAFKLASFQKYLNEFNNKTLTVGASKTNPTGMFSISIGIYKNGVHVTDVSVNAMGTENEIKSNFILEATSELDAKNITHENIDVKQYKDELIIEGDVPAVAKDLGVTAKTILDAQGKKVLQIFVDEKPSFEASIDSDNDPDSFAVLKTGEVDGKKVLILKGAIEDGSKFSYIFQKDINGKTVITESKK